MSDSVMTRRERFHEFWFGTQSTEALALFRIVFGIYLFFIFLISAPNWARFYGPWGTHPYFVLEEQGRIYWTIFGLSDSLVWTLLIYLVMQAATIFFTLGLFTPIATTVLFVGYASMLTRNTWMVNGQDQVAVLMLLFCCFAPLGAAYSLDQRRKGRGQSGERHDVWALRMLQISFAGIYLFCGPTKMETWARGDAMYYVSLSHQWFRYPRFELFHSIELSKLMTYVTVFIETAFPFLIWFKSMRIRLIGLMIAFHIMVMLLLSPAVFYFNLVMIVGLVAFIDNKRAIKAADWAQWKFRKFSEKLAARRLPWRSPEA